MHAGVCPSPSYAAVPPSCLSLPAPPCLCRANPASHGARTDPLSPFPAAPAPQHFPAPRSLISTSCDPPERYRLAHTAPSLSCVYLRSQRRPAFNLHRSQPNTRGLAPQCAEDCGVHGGQTKAMQPSSQPAKPPRWTSGKGERCPGAGASSPSLLWSRPRAYSARGGAFRALVGCICHAQRPPNAGPMPPGLPLVSVAPRYSRAESPEPRG